ncbi:MAG TPA: DUF4105 domain-containing protein [Chthoniobacterales bacterium]
MARNSRVRITLKFFVVLLLAVVTARADRLLSDQATASMWTVGPGPDLYAAFGHSALRIRDPELGVDRLYNFGTFNFETPDFYVKFVRGYLNYFLTAAIAPEVLEDYRQVTHQLVVEQELNLTPEELDRLVMDLENNLKPENAAYRYDFVLDNCSTRIRDVVARAADIQWPAATADTTLREHLRPYMVDRPLTWQGMQLVFGTRMDHTAGSAAETMFLPSEMKNGFDGATIGPEKRPLVRRTSVLNEGPRLPDRAPPWPLRFAVALAIVGLVAHSLKWRWVRFADATLFVMAGLIGVFLLFCWFGTRHWVLKDNWNLAWAWPSHLFVWFLPMFLRRIYWRVTAMALALFLVGMWFLPQEFPSVIVPVLVFSMVRAWARGKKDSEDRQPPASGGSPVASGVSGR